MLFRVGCILHGLVAVEIFLCFWLYILLGLFKIICKVTVYDAVICFLGTLTFIGAVTLPIETFIRRVCRDKGLPRRYIPDQSYFMRWWM